MSRKSSAGVWPIESQDTGSNRWQDRPPKRSQTDKFRFTSSMIGDRMRLEKNYQELEKQEW